MAKYRIIKKEVTNKASETAITYEVQKKVLFIWITASILAHYHTNDYRALLTRRLWTYTRLESAQKALAVLSAPRITKYRGHRVFTTFNDNLEIVYIDLSDCKYFGFLKEYGYNFSEDLSSLKLDIDRQLKTTKYTVCGTAQSA